MGHIVTFYSYKGGVGRTFALANTAVLLAASGYRVLVVDWDLEAPGLDKFFENFSITSAHRPGGILKILESYNLDQTLQWRDYIEKVVFEFDGELAFLPSGYALESYQQRLADFSWVDFYERGGGERIEALRADWVSGYDFVFIDSRTGVTDAGGVCTIQLPDTLVLVFTASQQSLTGTVNIANRVQRARQQSDFAPLQATLIPLLSRWDGRDEKVEGELWLKRVEYAVSPFLSSWVASGESHRRVIEALRVPHVAYFSFGEKLAVLMGSLTDPLLPGQAFATLAALLIESSWTKVSVTRDEICARTTKSHRFFLLRELLHNHGLS